MRTDTPVLENGWPPSIAAVEEMLPRYKPHHHHRSRSAQVPEVLPRQFPLIYWQGDLPSGLNEPANMETGPMSVLNSTV